MNVNLDFQIVQQDQFVGLKKENHSFLARTIEVLRNLVVELLSPPAIATVSFFFLSFLLPLLYFVTLNLPYSIISFSVSSLARWHG